MLASIAEPVPDHDVGPRDGQTSARSPGTESRGDAVRELGDRKADLTTLSSRNSAQRVDRTPVRYVR
jgi:hypothetical protein